MEYLSDQLLASLGLSTATLDLEIPTEAGESSDEVGKKESIYLTQKVQNMICVDGNSFTGMTDAITGAFVYGKLVDKVSGDVYEGPFRRGLRHGPGSVLTMSNGEKFIGR
jgi:hypothetical protein